ncbi:MAG TPA: histone deacetylase family protein [Acetobacteraceae bacterium]|jgi:acetoin utilization deacetylase AcuC-like enzyme|nr:histone deacetylase family protein [Acetobacteraceae bacterium]
MLVFWNPVQLRHAPRFFLLRGQVRPHFEVPARAEVLLAACRDLGLSAVTPPDADPAALRKVHDAGYLDFLRRAAAEWAALPDAGAEVLPNAFPSPEALASGGRRPSGLVGQIGWYGTDLACPIGPHTWEAAEAAAAGAIAAADAVAAGDNAYALARPPGHHAYPARSGGHCYLNNAAIAAERLRGKGAARVAILDVDSHHGNGTQGVFWQRPDVLFVSVHGDPNRYYPWYTGHAGERGGGDGEGANLNLPVPFGTGDDGWLEAIGTGIAAIRRFGAEALVVSLGFDASRDEPLNALAVTEDGFARAGAAIGALRLPAAIVQEGGYNLAVIGTLLARFLGGFGGG